LEIYSFLFKKNTSKIHKSSLSLKTTPLLHSKKISLKKYSKKSIKMTPKEKLPTLLITFLFTLLKITPLKKSFSLLIIIKKKIKKTLSILKISPTLNSLLTYLDSNSFSIFLKSEKNKKFFLINLSFIHLFIYF
jgi:hypothetical protein